MPTLAESHEVRRDNDTIISAEYSTWKAAHCSRRSLQLTRKRFATRDAGKTVVRATACCHRVGGNTFRPAGACTAPVVKLRH
jgi:hypothetical protein